MISFDDFEKVDIRAGTIIEVADNKKAKKPAYVFRIDFGSELGIKTSSAQFSTAYSKEELLNKQIIAVVNFEPKNVAGVISEVLILGLPVGDDKIAIMEPFKYIVENGVRLY